MVFPVLWAARLTPYGHDTLTYDQSRLPGRAPARRGGSRLAGDGADSVADGGAARGGAGHLCDHGIKRWRLQLAQEQMDSVAYGLWLHRMTGSAAEANRFVREYGVVHSPARDLGEGSPAVRGGAGVGGRG
ncbi:DUF6417 family protein [Streptomyces mirabilis]|uniref:DUF6417 family protein n=1 Tax=Streptomyces mirabilis TaxID=68239 RepID=UPI002B1CC832|nr:DUF6417 family protein [Streptomyces mirabilis]